MDNSSINLLQTYVLLSRIAAGKPITGTMNSRSLAGRMKKLTSMHLVYATRVNRVQYHLTDHGRAALPHLHALVSLIHPGELREQQNP